MGELVQTNQSVFIKGRCLHDNFLLVRQMARRLHRRKAKGVLLKLDITKAFDSLSWPFLFEVLHAKGFSERWISWIATLLTTASSRVLVNGCAGDKFMHAKGLRQGDPISPLLFVIAMDALTAIIIKAHEARVLSNINGCSPMQRLSLYADDVVLFIKPIRSDLQFVKEILAIFGVASGLNVNFAKSAAIMIRGENEDEEHVKSALPWRIDTFPCKYLGLQLSIRQLKRSEWQPIVDAALHILTGWQRGLVTRPGRLILVNQVMRVRATHHLMIAEAPKWALERVDKGCRAFFWAGTEEVHEGKCVVSWTRVCRPKQLGGLGVIDLFKHGIALRLRWEWLRRTDIPALAGPKLDCRQTGGPSIWEPGQMEGWNGSEDPILERPMVRWSYHYRHSPLGCG